VIEDSWGRNNCIRSNIDYCMSEKHQEESTSKEILLDMFSRSNMDFCMADLTSEGVYDHVSYVNV